ncbi:hypothetical protein F5Y16DRAFT_381279 [Xylariaceae sp. FL0255]|nr:hypothetical protein F5Y16DRAFT_381279 [Xylariaceae sp. FL0255]
MPDLDSLIEDANDQTGQSHEPDLSIVHRRASPSSIANAVELQLAAQLGREITHGLPVLHENGSSEASGAVPHNGTARNEHDVDVNHLDHHNGDHATHPLEEPNGQSVSQPPEAEYLQHDHHPQFSTVQHRQFEQQLQAFLPASESSEHLSSPQQQHQSQHTPQSRPPPPLQPHGQIDHAPHQQFSVNPQDDIPPRKRSKVSRACDECRRKKVKCDAPSESGEEPCSNCRRCSIRCLFSRIPQKRGPSKGYIKELADRIYHIEGKLASEGGNLDTLTDLLGGGRRESLDIFTPNGQSEEISRKRPFSSISGADASTPNSLRQGQWASSDPRPIQPGHANGARSELYSANRLAPIPLSKPEDTPSQTSAIEPGPESSEFPHSLKSVNSDAFDVYLNVVHQCLPFLAKTKARVQEQLAQCPTLLQDAFIETFHGTMQSFISAPGLYTQSDVGYATRLVAAWESDLSARNSVTNLVHLQMLILMVIGTDNYGPSSLKGEHGGPSKASVLGRAVGLAYSMRLHLGTLEASTESDYDLNENISVRAWWVLTMLDRWNAVSTASPLFIPNDSVVMLPQLNTLLGENVYHLTRLSNILGHFAPVSLAPPRALSADSAARPILNSFFNLTIELFREVLPTGISPSTHPTLHLVYWHSRLLSYLFQSNSKSADVFWACKESANLLLANHQLLSPLNHHFFCLTALSLLELAKVDATREEALPLLKDLLDLNLAPSTWDGVIRDRISEQIRPSSAQATAHQNLQQLATLATASKGDPDKPENGDNPDTLRTSTNYVDLGFDPSNIIHGGYLNILTQGH